MKCNDRIQLSHYYRLEVPEILKCWHPEAVPWLRSCISPKRDSYPCKLAINLSIFLCGFLCGVLGVLKQYHRDCHSLPSRAEIWDISWSIKSPVFLPTF